LARKVLDDLSPARIAEPILEELARKTGSTAVLGLINGNSTYIAAKRESEGGRISIASRLGQVRPLTYGAHGKAMVPFMSQEEQERILKEETLYFYGDPEKLDRTRLAKELAECSRLGFAYDFGEFAHGVNVVSTAVIGPGGTPIGFVQIYVLASAEIARAFGSYVVQAGKALSRELGSSTE
jgi:DNA-binding IclR family transcriptional regulator